MKRMLSILLSVALVLGLLPMTAAAVTVTETTNADFSQTNTAPALALLNSNGTVATWDGATKTLSFTDDLTFEATQTPALVLPPDSTVNIADGKTVSITCTLPPSTRSSCGLSALGSLTITGTGTLNVTAAGITTSGYAYPSYGLSVASGTLTIDGPTVTCTGGNISGSSAGGTSEGIDALTASIIVKSGSLTAKGGNVTCTGGPAYSYGAYAQFFTVNGGTVTMTGGSVSSLRVCVSYGVSSTIPTFNGGTVTMTGGTVTATAATTVGSVSSRGIYTYASADITGSTVSAIGGAVNAAAAENDGCSVDSTGFYASGSAIQITGGELTARGGNVTVTNTTAGESYFGDSRGLYYGSYTTDLITFSDCEITASSGTVSIAGGSGYKSSVAVSLNNNGGLNITGAAITAAGGTRGISCTAGATNITDSAVTATGNIGINPRDITVNGTSAVIATGVESGIECFRGNLTLNGGMIRATAQTPTGNTEVCLAAAIDAESVTVTGGHLIAEGSIASGDGDDISYGILCEAMGAMSVSLVADTPEGVAAFSGGITELKGTTNAIKAASIVTSNGLKPIDAAETFISGTTTELTQASAPKPVIIAAGIPLTVTGVTVTTKEYDGKKDATLDITSAVLKDGDDNIPANVSVSKAGAKAEFVDKNVGTSKNVTITSDLTLTGDDATLYVLMQPTGLTGEITPKTSVDLAFLLACSFVKGTPAFPGGWVRGVPITSGGVTSTTYEIPTGTYTYGWTPEGGTAESGKTPAETAAYLNTLDANTELTVTFAFTGTNNYLGATRTGNIAVTVVDPPVYVPSVPSEPEECDGGESCVSKPFKDVDTKQWYHKAVDYAIENKLMNGVGDGKFDPNGTLTRAMLCQILYNRAGKPSATAENKFTDVKSGEWYEKAVVWATENNIVMGYGGDKFGPDDPITREQLAAILWRYDGKPVTSGDISGFKDGKKTSDYAVTPMKWAVENKIVFGNDDGTLNPLGKSKRCEVAAMVMRYLEK